VVGDYQGFATEIAIATTMWMEVNFNVHATELNDHLSAKNHLKNVRYL
jgi:hypothetical protein